MSVLYVQKQGATLRLKSERVVVEYEDAVIESVRLRDTTAIVLVGRVGLTTPLMVELLDRGLPVVFVSSVGSYRGRLVGATTGDVFLRREQMCRLDDEPFRLLFATRVVAAKSWNGGVCSSGI